MITQNSEVYNPPTYLFFIIHVLWKKISVGGCILHCFVWSSLPCFLTFTFWYPYILLHFNFFYYLLYIQVASLASLAQLLPLRWPTVRNPAPDSSLCRAAAPQLRPLAPQLHPLQLLLPVCVRFQLLLLDCIRFSCCSRSRPLRLLLPDCIRFNCCSPIASASTAAHPIASALTACCSSIACIRLQPQLDSSPMFSNILRGVWGSVTWVRRSCVTIV